MPNIPTPIRAALGLAAAAVDEARKLPETLPQAVSTVPMVAISTAMQASLRVQQHIAALASRGDEVLSQLRGTSAEPPTWAKFDDPPAAAEAPDERRAAFDRIDYANTGFSEGEDDGPGRWDAVGVGGTEPDAGASAPSAPVKKAAARAARPKPTKKAEPARRGTKRSEPIKEVAKKVKPSKTPNPATMAAGIVQAHEANSSVE